MASADAPMKGIATLLEAFAKLRTERDLELLLVTKPTAGGRTEKLIEELGIGEHIKFVNGISDTELVEVMGSAEIAVVPSLYEGFSLPTAELMACETPLVVSRTVTDIRFVADRSMMLVLPMNRECACVGTTCPSAGNPHCDNLDAPTLQPFDPEVAPPSSTMNIGAPVGRPDGNIRPPTAVDAGAR